MKLIHGDCEQVLKTLDTNSIDALLTDPPAGISFMGKEWDSNKGGRDEWIAWLTLITKECLRVMKPGAHGLVWALPRTSHWTATALEDAGFEIRDVVNHLFGTGFPKSLNISKAIDKAAGVERKIIGKKDHTDNAGMKGNALCSGKYERVHLDITVPSTDAAKQWDGWGTALKPACEHWILIRKPISEKTVAKNVLKWGCGGLNIDGCRIETKELTPRNNKPGPNGWKNSSGGYIEPSLLGRFPANLTLDEYAARMLDEHSRFFYVAKASKSDRGLDNHHPTVKNTKLMRYLAKLITPPNGIILDPFMGSGSTGVAALKENFDFVGIELDNDYFTISEQRINKLK